MLCCGARNQKLSDAHNRQHSQSTYVVNSIFVNNKTLLTRKLWYLVHPFPTPRIESLSEKKLVGKRLSMTFANNQTQQLWQSFMPHRQKIRHAVNADRYSLQIYPPHMDFTFSNPEIPFEKWAAVEVSDFGAVPAEMETLIIPGGLYAVFEYQGLSTDPSIFQHIFGKWLPNSDYTPDTRPHFEILGDKYRNNDPNSEEEIWIPIRRKTVHSQKTTLE